MAQNDAEKLLNIGFVTIILMATTLVKRTKHNKIILKSV